ncbi:hypothetical protein NE237_029514 [Protea cynaroides]|uniref:Thiamine pyrophosphate enzyme N-terminal TPP-binding domain-containing protein n=1 Tax=Protea cynaroides TaxID=273540 RepID=A0A9Q0JV57_9MAGN|nr:hypothetical protein NE237_029514 [Protea cynaroides]
MHDRIWTTMAEIHRREARSISVTLGDCGTQCQGGTAVAALDQCMTECGPPWQDYIVRRPIKPDSGHGGTNQMMVKLWGPVGRHEVSSFTHIQGDNREDVVNVTSGQCTDQTLSPVSCLDHGPMDDNSSWSRKDSPLLLEDNAGSRGLKFSHQSSCCKNFSFSESIFKKGVALVKPHSLSKLRCSVQDCANINAVWASLIIEECTLGLTECLFLYFCIAPGSRLSPLAVAASSHPLTTCISCFDERALAFLAVGYTRGSYKPAVIITSSGTTISNFLPAVRYLIILTSCRNAAIYIKFQAVISSTWC